MKNNITVSIGIPAYNEEQNIQKILHAIVMQEESNFTLKEVIIVSDGSSDKTVDNAKQLQDLKIKIIDDSNRMGKSYRLNQIFSLCKGDILFLMDADIIITDNTLISKIISRTDFSKSGIIAVNANPVATKSFFAKSLNQCKKAEMDWRLKWNKGDNYLAFRGAFMGLYGNFARTVKMPSNLVNNDAYIYFSAKKKGYHPAYINDLFIAFKTPTSFRDHFTQSQRFKSSANELQKFFTISKKDYFIPIDLFLSATMKYFFENPVYAISYIMIRLGTKVMKPFFGKGSKSQWTIAISTKKL